MSKKSPELEAFVNKFAKQAFGHERGGKQCVFCGSMKVGPGDFRDEPSRAEFRISFLCQKCQDETFGSDDHGLTDEQLGIAGS